MTKINKNNNKNNILKFKKYLNSLSIKFIICTATVTLISVLSIRLFSFLYISNSINEEITRYNTQRLSYVKETVDNRVLGKLLNILDVWIDIFNNMSKDNEGNIQNGIWFPTRETPCLDSYTANEYNISIAGKFPQNYAQGGTVN